MARFEIKSKDGLSVRFSGKPRYNGSYLKPSYIEFSEVASPTPIAWEVGDYLDYSRTGMRYYLYSLPQPSKNARKGTNGGSFTYSNVQLYSATKDLEIALFRDLVDNDNNIHFSTSPDVVTFENVEGIARRIQACMDDLYPNKWDIRIADFDAIADAEVIEKIAEAKDFALSGGTCLDALSKIYELWEDIGWFHSYDSSTGKEVITIGYSNRRNAENTTESYLYGKGNGLTAIKRNQTNKDEFATRLYVYGSERNLPARYYNEKNILNAESVNIRNLMLPIEAWGKTNGKPDARLAYLENASAVAKFGIIPKVHYFDSEDAGADIYPSISGMTIGMLRTALTALGETKYYPSEQVYKDPSLRIDEVRYCENPEDGGEVDIKPIKTDEEEYQGASESVTSRGQFIIDDLFLFSHKFTIEKGRPCEVVVSPQVSGYVVDKGFTSVSVKLRFSDKETSAPYNPVKSRAAVKNGDNWEFELPSISYDYAQSPLTGFNSYIYLTIEAYGNDSADSVTYVLNEGVVEYSLNPIQDKTFIIRLHEIGFNIDEMAKRGNGKTISMKTGACAGRNFEIVSSRNKSGYWDITCKRQHDKTLGMLFPNESYQITAGDRFVLLDIAMPEVYILAAEQRLLSEGQKLLARASKVQTHYEPSIDAKVMVESERSLREGMFMEITDEDVVDNNTDYILIDTLSIYEDESAIPTYKVTLRERRKVTYKGTPSATSSNDTEAVGDDATAEVDLTGYATESYVDQKVESSITEIKGKDEEQDREIGSIEDRLAKAEEITALFGEDEDGNVYVKNSKNFYTRGEISAGGAGTAGGGGGGSDVGGGYLDSLYDVELNEIAIDANLSAAEKEAVTESQVLGYDSKGLWVNKKTMYIHHQTTNSAKWTITHGLNKMPNVKIVDSSGELVYGSVKYSGMNEVEISFGHEFAGKAYLD